ncbi:MAG: hypothetical protein ACSHWW_10095 [Nonlabens sp.]|uniref:hypothetical protein n=1 Tax=Nonlabens sp. TaxID=1888209 RepID=UPI003EF559F1
MKKLVLVCLCLAFAKALPAQIPQEELAKIKKPFIDMVNAPLNQVGPYSFTKEANNFKGDVFQAGFRNYDRNGNYIHEKEVLADLERAKKENKTYFKIENGLITERKIYYATDIDLFAYDDKDRITYYENEFWKYKYEYDSKSRVIKETAFNKEDRYDKVTKYKYSTVGDLLRVDISTTDQEEKEYDYYKIFKNGLLVENLSGMGVIKWTYEFDHKGNYISKDYTGSYADPRPISVMYYEDLDRFNKKGKIPWKKEEIVPGSKIAAPYIYVYNKTIRNIAPGRGIGGEVIFYLDIDQSYYSGKNAYADKFDKTSTGEALFLHRGDKIIMLYDGRYARLFDEGKSKKELKYKSYGKDYLVIDTVDQKQYLVKNVDASNYVNPAKKYVMDASFFGHDKKGGNYILFINGKTPDYSRIKKDKYTENGDPVVFYDGKPILILKGYFEMEEKRLMPAVPYKGEALRAISNKQPSSENAILAEYNPQLSIDVQKIKDNTYTFFQNGNQIKLPSYVIIDASKKDVIFGYGLADFMIADNAGLPLNKRVRARQIARENEIITQYINGKLTYLYNNGKALGAEDYVLSTVADDQYLIYLTNIKKSALVKVTQPDDVVYKGAYTYINNAWLEKGENGIYFYNNGTLVKGADYKWKRDNDGNAHIYMNNQPAYFLSGYNDKPVNQVYKLEPHSGQSIEKMSSSNAIKSEFTNQFLAAQKESWPAKATKKMLAEMESTMTQKGLDFTQKSQKYADLFNALYLIDKEYAFELMMNMNNTYVQKTQSFLTQEKRTFIRARAKKELQKYSGAHSNATKK